MDDERFDLAERAEWVAMLKSGGPLRQPSMAGIEDPYAVLNPAMTWDDVAWLREQWSGSLVLKGILDPDDARQAVAPGVDAVWVSNHGGRQLDSVSATPRALPAIAAAVGSRAEVLMDGGLRRGSDVAKAIALGAHACLIGRPYLWGLAVDGEAGVRERLRSYVDDLDTTLALLGRSDIAALDRSCVRVAEGWV